MRFLTSKAKVSTRFGGRFVQSIDEVSGGGSGGTSDWFYWVNGLLASKGAAEYVLSPGDFVQWDYRDWTATQDIRAIVGAYPEPFLNGVDGKRLPVRVECADAGSDSCKQAKSTLADEGVPASGAALGAPGNQKVIRVVVAPWDRARRLPTVRAIELGPRRSGVFARFAGGGEKLELLDGDGETVREAAPGTGIVAALRPTDDRARVGRHRARRCRRAAGSRRPRRARPPRRLRDRRRARRGGQAPAGGPMRLVPAYRDRPSPLHAARAGVTAAFCAALALVPGLSQNPIVLVAAGAAILVAGAAAGVGARAAPSALLLAAAGASDHDRQPARRIACGDTLLVRGGEVLGHRIDITLEALAAGGMAGLRLTVFMLAFASSRPASIPTTCCALFRRVSYRSALTAALATRLVPVLARDALRMGDAARCRPEPPGRLAVARAALSGALDRAVDVAAALEVRGYSAPGRPARGAASRGRATTSAVAVAALVIATAVVVGRRGRCRARRPSTHRPRSVFGPGGAALCAAVLLATAIPFAGRRARLGVARG